MLEKPGRENVVWKFVHDAFENLNLNILMKFAVVKEILNGQVGTINPASNQSKIDHSCDRIVSCTVISNQRNEVFKGLSKDP